MKMYFKQKNEKKIQTKKWKRTQTKTQKNWNKEMKKKEKKIHLELYREFDVSSSKLPPTHGKKGRKYYTN